MTTTYIKKERCYPVCTPDTSGLYCVVCGYPIKRLVFEIIQNK